MHPNIICLQDEHGKDFLFNVSDLIYAIESGMGSTLFYGRDYWSKSKQYYVQETIDYIKNRADVGYVKMTSGGLEYLFNTRLVDSIRSEVSGSSIMVNGRKPIRVAEDIGTIDDSLFFRGTSNGILSLYSPRSFTHCYEGVVYGDGKKVLLEESLATINTNGHFYVGTDMHGREIGINLARCYEVVGGIAMFDNGHSIEIQEDLTSEDGFIQLSGRYFNENLIEFATEKVSGGCAINIGTGIKVAEDVSESLVDIQTTLGYGIILSQAYYLDKISIGGSFPDERDILINPLYINSCWKSLVGVDIVVESKLKKIFINDDLDYLKGAVSPSFSQELTDLYNGVYVRLMKQSSLFGFMGTEYNCPELFGGFSEDYEKREFLVFFEGQLQKPSTYSIAEGKVVFSQSVTRTLITVCRWKKEAMPLSCSLTGTEEALYECIDDNAIAIHPTHLKLENLNSASVAVDFGVLRSQTEDDALVFFEGQLRESQNLFQVLMSGTVVFNSAPNRNVGMIVNKGVLQGLNASAEPDPVDYLTNNLFEYQQDIFEVDGFTGTEVDLSGQYPAGVEFPSDSNFCYVYFQGQKTQDVMFYTLDSANKKVIFSSLVSDYDLIIVVYGKKVLDLN